MDYYYLCGSIEDSQTNKADNKPVRVFTSVLPPSGPNLTEQEILSSECYTCLSHAVCQVRNYFKLNTHSLTKYAQ